jgi:transposase InsO family protein
MSVRRLIIEVDVSELNVTRFCRDHGVSRWFFYDLRRRYQRDGDAALTVKSRAPRSVANRTPVVVIELMATIHKELADAGLDAGPESVWDHLPGRLAPGQRCPSPATIYRHLRAGGFTRLEPAKAPKAALHRFVAARANERWQIDATGWVLADGGPVEIIDIVDDCSRVAASYATPRCTTASAFAAMVAAADRWGWPQGVLTDNGAPFRGFPGDDRPGGLVAALAALGIDNARARPFHPQTCGKVERFHRTVKQRLAALPAPATLAELQAQLDDFIDYYNHQRRHRGIDRDIPAQRWAATPRTGPHDRPLTPPSITYHATVTGGTVWAGHHCRITIGAAHNGQPATIIRTGDTADVFIAGRHIRHLTIDPTHRHQPLRQTVRNAPRQP